MLRFKTKVLDKSFWLLFKTIGFGSKLLALVQNKDSKLCDLVQNYGLWFKISVRNYGRWFKTMGSGSKQGLKTMGSGSKTVSFDLKRQAPVQNYWLYSNSKILIYNSKLWVLVHNSATS